MTDVPLSELDPSVASHAPEPSQRPWLYSKHELVVAPGMHRTTALRAGLVLAIGTLVLAMLASEPLVNWANRLPAHPIAEQVILGAQKWNQAMAAIGMTDIFDAAHQFFVDLRSF